MTSDQPCHVFQSPWAAGHHGSVTQQVHLHTESRGTAVLPSRRPATNPCAILPKWVVERGNWPTKMKAQQRSRNEMED